MVQLVQGIAATSLLGAQARGGDGDADEPAEGMEHGGFSVGDGPIDSVGIRLHRINQIESQLAFGFSEPEDAC
ncbi:hypothetical protein [Leptothrix cholodnii]|uniref:hypothetical protein n=1 Tax=Leptothrix cholodnii TaxID=34029 RepID=UPI00123707CB|nr:hypothetical protein [Leptothrix cholodnii]